MINEPDDWSFIIKLHALIEAAVTHLIILEIDRVALNELLTDLTFSAKIAILKRLDKLDGDAIAYFSLISRIRNRFAHSVTEVSRRIEDYVASLPPSERNQVWRWLAYFASGDRFTLPDGKAVNTVDLAQQNPRLATWWSAMNGIAVIAVVQKSTADLRGFDEKMRQHNESMATTFQALLKAIATVKRPEIT